MDRRNLDNDEELSPVREGIANSSLELKVHKLKNLTSSLLEIVPILTRRLDFLEAEYHKFKNSTNPVPEVNVHDSDSVQSIISCLIRTLTEVLQSPDKLFEILSSK